MLSRVSRPLKRVGETPPDVGVENADSMTAVVIVDLIANDLLEAREACGDSAGGVNAPLPAVVPIPGISGNTGLGLRQVKRSVEQAVGSDILANES